MRDCKTYFSYEHHQSNDLGFMKSEVHMCWHAVLLSDCVHCTCMLTSVAYIPHRKKIKIKYISMNNYTIGPI
jgi:hypothetical protein